MKRLMFIAVAGVLMASCRDMQVFPEPEAAQGVETRSSSYGSVSIDIEGGSSFEIDPLNSDGGFQVNVNYSIADGYEYHYYETAVTGTYIVGKYHPKKEGESGSDGSKQYGYKFFRPGEYTLKGELKVKKVNEATGNEEYQTIVSDPVTVIIKFPYVDDVCGKIYDQLNSLWELNISDENVRDKYEFGYCVYLQGGKLELDDLQQSTQHGCGSFGVTIKNRESNWSNAPDDSYAKYAVAMVHTHPPLVGCNCNTERTGGLSLVDTEEEMDGGIPLVALDYIGKVNGYTDVKAYWEAHNNGLRRDHTDYDCLTF